MIEGKWYAPGAEMPEALQIRQAVFGRGADAQDALSWNVLVWQDGEAAATGRLWWQDGAFWLGDIAVLPEKRRQGLGDLTLRLLLFKAESHAARMMRLNTPAELTAFFGRLGFRQEETRADGLVAMSLRGEDLCLDQCKGCQKDCPNRK